MHPHPRALPAAAAAATMALAATVAGAQPGTGAPYGARDARACTVPAPRGAPSVAEATLAFLCTNEHEYNDELLYLYDQVRLQVGAGRPFQLGTDEFKDVDAKATVYPVRGGFVKYQCSRRRHEQAMGNDPNTNCYTTPSPNASRVCNTTTFRDLRCVLLDARAAVGAARVAPPRG